MGKHFEKPFALFGIFTTFIPAICIAVNCVYSLVDEHNLNLFQYAMIAAGIAITILYLVANKDAIEILPAFWGHKYTTGDWILASFFLYPLTNIIIVILIFKFDENCE